MEKILISACLLGEKVKYNGKDNFQGSEMIQSWQKEGRVVPFCPEVAGGLPVPRNPVEISGGEGKDVLSGQGKTLDNAGNNLTEAFVAGAQETLLLAKKHNIKLAVLKEGSPSCGSHLIYDGLFRGIKIPGKGVTARLLEQNGIETFNEEELENVLQNLTILEKLRPSLPFFLK